MFINEKEEITKEKLGICSSAIKKSRINCNEIYEYCHTKITIFELFSVHLLCLCLEFIPKLKNIFTQVVTRVKVSITKFVSQVISIPHQLIKDSKQLKNSNFGVIIFVYFITIYP